MIITVTQYNNFIKALLDNEPMLSRISVSGEVSNLHDNGESIFFTLKDAFSQMDCFMYADKASVNLFNGCSVVAEGRPTYLKSGRISFTVAKVNLLKGEGEQYLNFLALKKQLQESGYFDLSRKKLLPKFIFTVGVVTSPTGAVIHDIYNVAKRRNKYVRLTLFPVKVQGENASSSIAAGIRYFSERDVDVVIVARGGGSAEDLFAFNTKEVADAVYKCAKPIISAVGHETNYTICDFCADVRASTPSVAAELITAHNLPKELNASVKSLREALTYKISDVKNRYLNAVFTVNNALNKKIAFSKRKLNYSINSCGNLLLKKVEDGGSSLKLLEQKIKLLSPKNLLLGGKAFIYKKGVKVSSVDMLSKGDKIKIVLIDGVISAAVEKIDNK